MLSGYYTIASGMMTRQKEMDVIGNNLVNMQTPGFRSDRTIISAFEQELLTRREANGSAVLGTGIAATSAVIDEVHSIFHSGELKSTERNMDIAIAGDGFFQIQGADGQRMLTRNGQFDIDEAGNLILPNYGTVLGEDGAPLHVERDDFVAEPDGALFNAEGQSLGRIQVVTVPDNAQLLKQTNGTFQIPEGVQSQPATASTLIQGRIELSNVNMNQELTNLMEVQRAFQACSSALQVVDSINRKAASQLAAL